MVYTFRIKNGFHVHEFLTLMNDKVDYLFSKKENEDFYLLLNIDAVGQFDIETVEKMKEAMSVVVIKTDKMEMTTHNIDEMEVVNAIMNMK